jgi:hypothetical protein
MVLRRMNEMDAVKISTRIPMHFIASKLARAMVVIAAASILACGKTGGAVTTTTATTTNTAAMTTTINAAVTGPSVPGAVPVQEFVTSFKANAKSLTGKPVTIRGQFASKSKGISDGHPIVQVWVVQDAQSYGAASSVSCDIDGSTAPDLRVGAPVTVSGTARDLFGTPELEGCKVLSPAS